VDLAQRAASVGELRRFAQKFGVRALVDREGKAFQDHGLAHANLTDTRWLDKLVEAPALLRTPLVRNGKELTIGEAEPVWREWCGR
jgi:arsenate reductase-like glutaredoxin family protein